MSLRQIVLDTETTGLEVEQGHRLIEVGCVEMRNRRLTGNTFHYYINPEREIDAGAQEVHGISLAQLLDKPKFGEISAALWKFLAGAELIIHNATFDMGFLNAEFKRTGMTQRLDQVCTVLDTLPLARHLHPGQRVNLDALCKRYSIDNSHRELHGALMDARLLADVYLAMTGGQVTLGLAAESSAAETASEHADFVDAFGTATAPLRVIRASADELAAHQARLQTVKKKAGKCLWSEDLPAPPAG